MVSRKTNIHDNNYANCVYSISTITWNEANNGHWKLPNNKFKRYLLSLRNNI